MQLIAEIWGLLREGLAMTPVRQGAATICQHSWPNRAKSWWHIASWSRVERV
jgi:hypothetical protein